MISFIAIDLYPDRDYHRPMTNNKLFLLASLASLATACAPSALESPDATHVVLVDGPTHATITDGPVWDAAVKWEELGYTFDSFEGEECVGAPAADCKFTILVTPSTQDQVFLQYRMIGVATDYLVAHEVGHVLLNSLDNSPTTGVMSNPPTLEFTDADRAFVCAYGGLCGVQE